MAQISGKEKAKTRQLALRYLETESMKRGQLALAGANVKLANLRKQEEAPDRKINQYKDRHFEPN